MSTDPGTVTDQQRIVAVRRLMASVRRPSPTLDRLTGLAAELVEAPISLLTLVDSDRQIFLSSFGLPEVIGAAGQTSIEYSICQHAVTTGRPLIVADAHTDPVLQFNKAVLELGVTSYAGMPLITPEGYPVGTLCVLDRAVRDWTDDQLVALSHLADIAMDEIWLRFGDGAAGDQPRVDGRWSRV